MTCPVVRETSPRVPFSGISPHARKAFACLAVVGLAIAGWSPRHANGQDTAAQPGAAATPAQPADTKPAATSQSAYVRGGEEAEGDKLFLETSVRTFTNAKNNSKVALVGAVHVGDKAYYDALQEYLNTQELVLFEGVKPAAGRDLENADDAARAKVTTQRQRLLGIIVSRHFKQHQALPESFDAALAPLHGSFARLGTAAITDGWGSAQQLIIPANATTPGAFDIVSLGADKAEGGEGAAADMKLSDQRALSPQEIEGGDDGLQLKLAKALGLEFQLVAIDYSNPKWVNSDMDIEQVRTALEAGGGGSDELFKLLDGSSGAAKILDFMLGMIERMPQVRLSTKVMMIQMLARADELMAAQGGAAGGAGPGGANFMKVIIEDRNDVVLADLSRTLATEKPATTIALFYGAGHLADMEAKLVKDFGYTFESDKWFRAIEVDLTGNANAKMQAKQMRDMIDKLLDRQMKKPAAK